ncbi:delta(24)-sterol reductase [Folsomia candida]|uniref:delta(24)-sterol reductase n=1 Tax=Folsomia candida TaxID=158441 RepID=UPI0016053657|nr:delta(24)-sterol reductase [Folsomia candida]
MARPRFFEAVILHICRYYVTPFLVIGRAVTLPILNILESISANLCCRVVNSPEVHAKKVDHVKKQILDWNANGRRTKLCTARSGWKSMSLRIPTYKATMTGIDLDSLDEVVKIDEEAMTVTVEPLVKMGPLTKILDAKGWTIPVVPELDFLTVGGLICGAGLETSSHKYGLFHNTCISYEVVLASGEAVNANKDENSDLFYAIPGSYGTIGFLTSATIRIFKAEKYVKLSCIPVNSLAEATERITEESLKSPGPDFVEGIMYSLDKGVIMVGSLSSKAEPGKINSVTRWYKKSFYKHVETFLSSSQLAPKVEYIPLRDYYHRHTYCIFWIGPQYIPYVNNALFRLIFGWTGPGDNYTYKIMPPYFRRLFEINMVVQDLVVPIDKTKMALQYFHDTVEVYPVWLCPAKSLNEPGFFKVDGDAEVMHMDIGIYGQSGKPDDYEVDKSNKSLEQFCLGNKCWKGMYADTWFSRDEFYQMFDPTLYNKVRTELNCLDAFPDVYEKIAGRK